MREREELDPYCYVFDENYIPPAWINNERSVFTYGDIAHLWNIGEYGTIALDGTGLSTGLCEAIERSGLESQRSRKRLLFYRKFFLPETVQ